MKKSVLRELKKYLGQLDKKELEKEVIKLYQKFPLVKKYYIGELSDDSEAILASYKAKLKKEYFPERGFGKARTSESKKIINEFKKIAIHQKDVVELLLYRVEMMLDFTNTYGDINDSFYGSLYNSFGEACNIICDEHLEDYYKNKCHELVEMASPIGWGIYDEMIDICNRTVGWIDYE